MASANYEEDLRQAGLKKTKHRTEILKILDKSSQPMLVDDIYVMLKNMNVSINLSTVYRTLENLTEKAVLNKVQLSGENKALYEYNRMVHRHYLVCNNCKRITVIEHCPLEAYEKSIEKETQFIVTGHKLDVYGYCPDCQKKGKDK